MTALPPDPVLQAARALVTAGEALIAALEAWAQPTTVEADLLQVPDEVDMLPPLQARARLAAAVRMDWPDAVAVRVQHVTDRCSDEDTFVVRSYAYSLDLGETRRPAWELLPTPVVYEDLQNSLRVLVADAGEPDFQGLWTIGLASRV